ncbi:hypothetical protein V1517DRAFT_176846 [Lipomyces orientalis]|uniref:Uncharacterized protein n=1 Tax=Lipomyces orientalis TaxID=1233043 RepID=A0ACC3TZ09_9ASCO
MATSSPASPNGEQRRTDSGWEGERGHDTEALNLLALPSPHSQLYPALDLTPASSSSDSNSLPSSSSPSLLEQKNTVSPPGRRAGFLAGRYEPETLRGVSSAAAARKSHYSQRQHGESFTEVLGRDDLSTATGSTYRDDNDSIGSPNTLWSSPTSISDADVARVANLVVHLRDSRSAMGNVSTKKRALSGDNSSVVKPTQATLRRVLRTKAWFELHAAFVSQSQVLPHNVPQTFLPFPGVDGVYNPLQTIRNRYVRERRKHRLEIAELSTITPASSAFRQNPNINVIWEVDVNEMFADWGWRERNRMLLVGHNGLPLYKPSRPHGTYESREKDDEYAERRNKDDQRGAHKRSHRSRGLHLPDAYLRRGIAESEHHRSKRHQKTSGEPPPKKIRMSLTMCQDLKKQTEKVMANLRDIDFAFVVAGNLNATFQMKRTTMTPTTRYLNQTVTEGALRSPILKGLSEDVGTCCPMKMNQWIMKELIGPVLHPDPRNPYQVRLLDRHSYHLRIHHLDRELLRQLSHGTVLQDELTNYPH